MSIQPPSYHWWTEIVALTHSIWFCWWPPSNRWNRPVIYWFVCDIWLTRNVYQPYGSALSYLRLDIWMIYQPILIARLFNQIFLIVTPDNWLNCISWQCLLICCDYILCHFCRTYWYFTMTLDGEITLWHLVALCHSYLDLMMQQLQLKCTR